MFDIEVYFKTHLRRIANNHIANMSEEYNGQSLNYIDFHISTYYDMSKDLESMKEDIGREVSEKEEQLFRSLFAREVVSIKRNQLIALDRGWR